MRRTTIRVPAVPYVRKPLWERFLIAMGYIAIGTIGYAIFMLAIFEFMVGCGEKTYHMDGTWTTNECLFIPYEPVKGTW